MKNVYEVLRQKEMELTRLEKEVEALRLVAPLLSEEKENLADIAKPALANAVNGPQATPRVTAPPAFGLTAPARPSGAEIPARMAGDSSASQHLLLKWKGVHETGSTPTPVR